MPQFDGGFAPPEDSGFTGGRFPESEKFENRFPEPDQFDGRFAPPEDSGFQGDRFQGDEFNFGGND